jgi:hypothetical protein
MYAMNIQNDVIGLVLRENCKSKQVTDFIAWPSRCHDTIYNNNKASNGKISQNVNKAVNFFARFFRVNLVVCFDSILPKYTSALLFSEINPSSEHHREPFYCMLKFNNFHGRKEPLQLSQAE